jgi:hypothetical protein
MVTESPPSHAGSPTFGEQCKDGDHSHQPAGGSSIYQPSSSDVLHPTVHVEVSVESVPDTAPEAVEEPPVPLTSVGEVDLHRRNMHCWKYPTAGGDWIAIQSERHEASRASQSEKHVWRKRVLNSGVSLCEGQLSGQPDPRKQARKPEADGFERRKLELPNWASGKGEQAENPPDDHHMHYTPYKSTSKQRFPTPKSHLSTPVSFMPRGVAQTPKATKAAALGLISNGGKGSSGNSPGLATKSGRQHVGVERTRRRLFQCQSTQQTQWSGMKFLWYLSHMARGKRRLKCLVTIVATLEARKIVSSYLLSLLMQVMKMKSLLGHVEKKLEL